MSGPVDDSYPPPPFLYVFYGDKENGRLPPPPPPVPPPNTEYRSFGCMRTKIEDMNGSLAVEKTYKTGPNDEIDFKSELQRLTRELFFLYVELLRVSSTDPSRHEASLNAFNRVFANVQFLVNRLRPHQARASLEFGLAQQVAAMRRAASSIDEKIADADRCLEGLAAQLGASESIRRLGRHEDLKEQA